MFDAFDVAGNTRNPVYVALAVIWISAVSFVVYRHRREGLPLMNGARHSRASQPARETSVTTY
jgi:hypothetical protein